MKKVISELPQKGVPPVGQMMGPGGGGDGALLPVKPDLLCFPLPGGSGRASRSLERVPDGCI